LRPLHQSAYRQWPSRRDGKTPGRHERDQETNLEACAGLIRKRLNAVPVME
jgi:hypothetical protein